MIPSQQGVPQTRSKVSNLYQCEEIPIVGLEAKHRPDKKPISIDGGGPKDYNRQIIPVVEKVVLKVFFPSQNYKLNFE
jgi:hypothetical protein